MSEKRIDAMEEMSERLLNLEQAAAELGYSVVPSS